MEKENRKPFLLQPRAAQGDPGFVTLRRSADGYRSVTMTPPWPGWVGEDGSARIVEVIDYDFGSQARHGIFRDVPGLSPDARVVVSSPTAPDDVLVTGTAYDSRIRVGDPNRTVRGRHRYTIEYPLAAVAPSGALSWKAVGSSWTVPIERAHIHVVAPFRLAGLACSRGGFGATDPCEVRQPEPGHLSAEVERLDAGQGVTISATAAGAVARPSLALPPTGAVDDPGAGVVPILSVGVLSPLMAASTVSVLVRRAGRERVTIGGAADAAWADTTGEDYVLVDQERLAELATIEFAPPPELSPAQGGVVLTEGVGNEHKVAWLLEAAIQGYVDLEHDDGMVTLKRGDRRDGETAYELDLAFGGRDWLWLGSYD